MKKILLLCLFAPLFGIGQTKNVVSAFRVFPKVDKVAEFEKALTAHAQKYHTGDWKWRVYAVETGPDYGGYHIIEGPNSWDAFDKRGNLGQAHMDDWNKNVAIHLTERTSASYSVYQEELSSVPLGDYSDKITIMHMYPKVGWNNKVSDLIKTLKKSWDANNETVAVYSSSSSGPSQYALVTRHKQGLKEKDSDFRKPFIERFEGANGARTYDDFIENVRQYINEIWSEMLSLRAELGSK